MKLLLAVALVLAMAYVVCRPRAASTCEEAKRALADASAEVANWSPRVQRATGEDLRLCQEELQKAEEAYRKASDEIALLCK